jgi:hypothetical protein
MVADWSVLKTLKGSTGTWKFEPSLEEASRFVREHRIDPERLAMFRARPGVVFAALRDEAGTCALAAFDTGFPSICPIAMIRLEHAKPVFDALFPHARHPHVHICVEGDAALAETLRHSGAKVECETFRMGAALG